MESAKKSTRAGRCRPTWSALIADYENGLKGRLYAIVNELVQSNALTGTRPPYVRELTQVRTLAPIPRPRMIMNTAVNFYSHIAENAPPEQRAQGDRRAEGESRRPLHVPQGALVGDRYRRDDPDSVRPDGARLGDRAGDGHRQAGPLRPRTAGAGPHLRLHRDARHLGPRRPPARRLLRRRRLVRHEGSGHLRADGPVHRPEGVLRRPDGEAEADAARRRRPAAAGRCLRHDPLRVAK